MAVVAVTIIREEYARQGAIRTGTRVYQVQVDGLTDDAESVLSADDGTTAVDEVGDAWSATSTATCKSQKAGAFNEDQLTYEVTCEYSSKSEEEVEDPLSRPNQYSYTSEQLTEPYFRDTDDLPVTNSAGEPYDELPQREVSRGTITITRNVASYSDVAAEGFRGLINSSDVTINGATYNARKLRITGYNASGPNEENGVTFWTETITIAKNAAGWDHLLEDRGRNELDSGKLKPILDAHGEAVELPYPLDGAGAAKAAPTDTPATRTHKPYLAGAFPTGL